MDAKTMEKSRLFGYACQNIDPMTLESILRFVFDSVGSRLSTKKIADNYPKYLLTLDDDPNADFDGIRKLNALDWLLF